MAAVRNAAPIIESIPIGPFIVSVSWQNTAPHEKRMCKI